MKHSEGDVMAAVRAIKQANPGLNTEGMAPEVVDAIESLESRIENLEAELANVRGLARLALEKASDPIRLT